MHISAKFIIVVQTIKLLEQHGISLMQALEYVFRAGAELYKVHNVLSEKIHVKFVQLLTILQTIRDVLVGNGQ